MILIWKAVPDETQVVRKDMIIEIHVNIVVCLGFIEGRAPGGPL